MAKVKVSKPVIAKPKTVPFCSKHHVELAYNPETVRWECPTEGCRSVRHPSVDNEGRPVVGKGKITLLRFGDEKGHDAYYLRTENNVLIRIDDLVTNAKDGVSRTYLTLAFDSVTELSP